MHAGVSALRRQGATARADSEPVVSPLLQTSTIVWQAARGWAGGGDGNVRASSWRWRRRDVI